MKRKQKITAASNHPSQLHGVAVAIELIAAASDGIGKQLSRFKMLAYTGGMMNLSGWYEPVVVDLGGVKVAGSVPILRQHDPEKVIGHTDIVKIDASGIAVEGVISGTGADAVEVKATSNNGFPWQASLGASPDRVEFLDAGKKATVNGQEFSGPINIVRASTIVELSFVPIGADMNTSASVAAATQKEHSMKFEQWLKANGFDEATLTPTKLATLKAAFEAKSPDEEISQLKAAWTKAPEKKPEDPPAKIEAAADTGAAIKAHREAIAAETTRIDTIRLKCGGRHADIEAEAIRDGWTPERAELAVLRAARPQAPAGHVPTGPVGGEMIEAAFCVSRRIPNVEKMFKPEVLEGAHKHYRNIGINQILMLCACANGYAASPGTRVNASNVREVLQYAMPPTIRGAFSSVSLPGIFSGVANKELLAGYMEEDQTWRDISVIKSVGDFKQVTSYRLLDNLKYEELAPLGTIKHGTLSEESYTRQAKTYAKMFALDRTMIINDDLAAFDDLRNRLGRGAARAFNDKFWAKFMDNASFFTSGRVNYITGATTNLGVDGVGLELGLAAFYKLKSPASDGAKRIGGLPEILLVPPELAFIAQRIYQSQDILGSSGLSANIHAGKYRVVVVPWLSDPAFSGYSTTAWYLLRGTSALAALVVSFLDGVQTPTVESAEADFNQLGIQFRGYHDFGIDQAEYLAGIKSKGAA